MSHYHGSHINFNTSQQALVGFYDVSGYFYLPGATQVDGAPQELRDITNPHWAKFPPQNQMIVSLIGFLYFVFSIVNGFGNTAVITVFCKTKSLQTPANIFVLNLALSDLLMMLTQGPITIISGMRSKWWSFGALGCEIYGYTGGVFGVCSIMSMALIGFDRFLVITQGISGPRIKIPHAIALVLLIWSYAIAINTPPLLKVWNRYSPEGLLATCSFDYLTEDPWHRTYPIFIFCTAYVFPLLVLIYCYSKIVSTVWAHEKSLREQAKKMNVESLRAQTNDKEASMEFKIAKAALLSVLLWVVIWTPYAVVAMVGAYGDKSLITPVVSVVPANLCKAASCINPVVFAISHPKFKAAFKNEYGWLYCVDKKKGGDGGSSTDNSSTATTIKP